MPSPGTIDIFNLCDLLTAFKFERHCASGVWKSFLLGAIEGVNVSEGALEQD